MKKLTTSASVMIIGIILFSFACAVPSLAWVNSQDPRSFHQWFVEGEHATMINALLISASDAIVKHNERFVMMGEEYSQRDALLRVYGLRKQCDDSVKDAFLAGLKANNLIYLIHVADDNPSARKMAISDLRLLADIVGSTRVKREFPYWADLLEEGRYPSKKLSHIYVHYTTDIGDFYEEQLGVNKRFYFWLGYLVNDTTVANLCENPDWMATDQQYLEMLYGDRMMGVLTRSTLKDWWTINTSDLALQGATDKVQRCLDSIKSKYTNRDIHN